jgi:hypothetical protein
MRLLIRLNGGGFVAIDKTSRPPSWRDQIEYPAATELMVAYHLRGQRHA